MHIQDFTLFGIVKISEKAALDKTLEIAGYSLAVIESLVRVTGWNSDI